ncbi:MAG: hypothetical protein AABX29_05340 [Nanoarchaeota archaeon]
MSIVGEDFIVAMESDRSVSGTYVAYNADSFTVSASTPKLFNTKITVPIGKHSGSKTGTITYTVLEA